jgi:hypothetical protein
MLLMSQSARVLAHHNVRLQELPFVTGSLARPKPQQGLDGSRRPPHHRTKITSTESRLFGKVSASVSFGMADYPPRSVSRTCLKALGSRRDTCIALLKRYIKSRLSKLGFGF